MVQGYPTESINQPLALFRLKQTPIMVTPSIWTNEKEKKAENPG